MQTFSCRRRSARSSMLIYMSFVALVTFLSCARSKVTLAENETYELTWTEKSVQAVPISLTASDGTGLLLQTFDAKAVIQGPLAFTELHLSFENLENRIREGHFEITLPPGAAISRFAMKIGNRWQEAEVVERQKARQTYEDFLHRRQDPALLEKKAGNQFRGRVFPIPAQARKEIIIAYSQNVHRSPYTLYVSGLPMMESFKVDVRNVSGNGEPVAYHSEAESFVPKGNVVLKSKQSAPSSTQWVGLQHGELRLVQVTPHFEQSQKSFESMAVWLDTSASRGMKFAEQVSRLGELIKTLEKQNGHTFRLVLICFDQTISKIYDGPSDGFGTRQKQNIIKRDALGASNLSQVLNWAASKDEIITERVLLISDGILTAGTQAQKKLQTKIKALSKHGVKRFDVMVDGGIRDETLLAGLVNAGLERAGVVMDATEPAQETASRLLKNTLSEVAVQVENADWVWPTRLQSVQSGDSHLIYIGAPAGTTVKVGLAGITNASRQVHFQWAEGPLLERASAIAQIEMVSNLVNDIEDEAKRNRLQQRVVDLSIQNRVLSDYTGLLVLETERDYKRYGIERTALADILVVGNEGVERKTRDEIIVANRSQGKGGAQPVGVVGAAPARDMPKMSGRQARRESPREASVQSETRFAIRGPMDNPNPHMAREMAREMQRNQGVLSYLADAPDAPTSPFGQAPPEGDPENALGNLVGNQVGENFGYNGLRLSGTGRGGGGSGEGTIGLGNLNTIGHGAGGGSGAGYARGVGGLGGRRGRAPAVRSGTAMVQGNLSKEVIRRIVHRHINEVKFCYERELAQNSGLEGRVTIKFLISKTGAVQTATVGNSTLNSTNVENCMAQAVRRWTFPQPNGNGVVLVEYPFQLTAPQENGRTTTPRTQMATNAHERTDDLSDENLPPIFAETRQKMAAAALKQKSVATAFEGKLDKVMSLIAMAHLEDAYRAATAWRQEEPKNLLALVALGEVFEAQKETAKAARAYGSIIDFYPSRADMRRMAGERLERLGDTAKWLVLDTYKHAVKQRPDHPASHRLYAWALFRVGKYHEAITAMKKGVDYSYPGGRFRGVVTGMKDELKLMAAAWQVKEPKSEKMKKTVTSLNLGNAKSLPATRFVLHWESDANDVDLHVYDKYGNHASYENKSLPTGGNLLADVTTGYGPEFFTIPKVQKENAYTLQAHYYNRGPMGYGMGTLQIITDDGNGNLSFNYRPFIVMQDGAYVGLGQFGV